MFFKYFSRQILLSRTFQDSPVYSSTFQACANPDIKEARLVRGKLVNKFEWNENDKKTSLYIFSFLFFVITDFFFHFNIFILFK